MDVKILYNKIWTYNVKLLPGDRKKEGKLPISYLNREEYTHIHGELQVIIDGKVLPKMGMESVDDVCFGYWIEMLSGLLEKFSQGYTSYTIEGGEQGKPGYKFELEGDYIYLSIVDSPLGGRKDPLWQRVPFKLADFKREFKKFKMNLLEEIAVNTPDVLEEWSSKFQS